MVETRLGPAGVQRLQHLLRRSEIRVINLTDEMASEAIEGFRHYGKGRHPAALNLGDCHTYGAARVLNAPVLCVENEFAKTDLAVRP